MAATRLLLTALVGASLAAAAHTDPAKERALKARAGTTLIPESCFTSQDELDTYFGYAYPWNSDTHNGAAIMKQSQVSIIHNAYLQLQSDYTGPQADNPDISYNSGTIYAKQHFTVSADGGLDFKANFVAPVQEGTWPAFWLDGVNSWPPEIDLAEWKGDGKISFNTFNTSSEVAAHDATYPSPTTAWRTVLVELRPESDGSTLKIDFYLDGTLMTTQYGKGMVGEPFWMIIDYQMLGSSGSTGPTETTYFDVQYLSVTSYNP